MMHCCATVLVPAGHVLATHPGSIKATENCHHGIALPAAQAALEVRHTLQSRIVIL
jgi:hypothetical protein